MRFLICFDKFKDNMSAHTAIEVCRKTLLDHSIPPENIATAALTDGGEGFARILTEAAQGQLKQLHTTDARSRPIDAQYGVVPTTALPSPIRKNLNLEGSLGIVEMAQASGLQTLPRDLRDCWQTTTLGTGQIIRHLTENEQVDGLLIGLGGSATNDLGLGVLEALGLRFLDKNGQELTPFTPNRWAQLHSIEGELPKAFPKIYIACDVQNPLFGPTGAAAVYGAQKGLSSQDLPAMEEAGKKVATLLSEKLGSDPTLPEQAGMGAAGGFAFGLTAAYGSNILNGFELVSQWLQLDQKLAASDWLLTGEGKVDKSSLHGKGPVAMALQALQAGKHVSILAGCIELQKSDFPKPELIDLLPISPDDMPLEVALKTGPQNLEKTLRTLLA